MNIFIPFPLSSAKGDPMISDGAAKASNNPTAYFESNSEY
jgi:hypothetical protein